MSQKRKRPRGGKRPSPPTIDQARPDDVRELRSTDSEGQEHVLRIAYDDSSGFFERMYPERSYDGERDWYAWRDSIGKRTKGASPPSPPPTASLDAIQAAQRASSNHGHIGEKEKPIDAAAIRLAALLTAQISDYRILGWEGFPFRWDIFVDVLNRYPHPCSSACRWLVPALKNFLGEPRETPEELWSTWEREEDRTFQLTLHPWSTRFQGKPPHHSPLDEEDRGLNPPVARTRLERWRIRAHLLGVPRTWELRYGRFLKRVPQVSTRRLNELIHFSCSVLSGRFAGKYEMEPGMGALRSFLLREAQIGDSRLELRRRYRESLGLMHEALLRGLVKRRPLRLEEGDIREYEMLLGAIQMEWKYTEKFPFQERMRHRLDFVVKRGWPADSLESSRLVNGQEVGLCPPREVAAILMCLRLEHGTHHPQTILEALAEARKLYGPIYPETIRRTKRGRPPKPREFSPTTPDSD